MPITAPRIRPVKKGTFLLATGCCSVMEGCGNAIMGVVVVVVVVEVLPGCNLYVGENVLLTKGPVL
jgi:hypothetical protein